MLNSFCLCGCKTPIKFGNSYVNAGHSVKGKTNWRKGTGKPKLSQLCACGICGLMTNPGRKFVKGHATKNTKLSEEHIGKISVALQGENNPRFGKEPVNKGLTKETSESIARGTEKMKATKQANPRTWSDEERERRALTQKPSWNLGLTKETDERVADIARKVSETTKGKPGRIPSDEERLRLSQSITELWTKPGHREKVHESLSGMNHPYYKARPGLTPETLEREYDYEFNDDLKDYIRNRDGKKCMACLKSQSEDPKKPHHVHHIDENKRNSDPSNLITLCVSCHAKVSFLKDREVWRDLLFNLATFQENYQVATLNTLMEAA